MKKKIFALAAALFLMGNGMAAPAWAAEERPAIEQSVSQEKKTLFPIYVVQKTGNDAQRNVWLFVGDGYTAAEQDKFIKDLTERVQRIMEMEPYRSFNGGLNIYAALVPSKESGAGRDANKDGTGGVMKDTYFQIRHNSFGLERLAWFNGDGEKHLEEIKKDLLDHYLDPGAEIMHTTILSNSTNYFGGGAMGYSVASLAAGEAMVIHEASHGFANLADEYNGHPEESPNKTKQTKLKKIPWREFLGFRDVTLYTYGDGAHKPVKEGCIMNDLYKQHGYCEVCKEHVADVLNARLGESRHPYYMAEPSLNLYEKDPMVTGQEIHEENLTEANGHALSYRTVVKNFTDKPLPFTLHLRITGKDGQVKYEKMQQWKVKAGKVQSLALVTPVMKGLEKGDHVEMVAVGG